MKYFLLLFLLLTPALYGKQKDLKAVNNRGADKAARVTTPQAAAKPALPMTLVMGTVEQWRVLAEDRYPDLKVPASEFSVAFESAYKVTQEENPDFLLANDWPVRLAQLVARRLKEGQPASLAAVRR